MGDVLTGERGNLSGSPLLNIRYMILDFALAYVYRTMLDHVGRHCV